MILFVYVCLCVCMLFKHKERERDREREQRKRWILVELEIIDTPIPIMTHKREILLCNHKMEHILFHRERTATASIVAMDPSAIIGHKIEVPRIADIDFPWQFEITV